MEKHHTHKLHIAINGIDYLTIQPEQWSTLCHKRWWSDLMIKWSDLRGFNQFIKKNYKCGRGSQSWLQWEYSLCSQRTVCFDFLLSILFHIYIWFYCFVMSPSFILQAMKSRSRFLTPQIWPQQNFCLLCNNWTLYPWINLNSTKLSSRGKHYDCIRKFSTQTKLNTKETILVFL